MSNPSASNFPYNFPDLLLTAPSHFPHLLCLLLDGTANEHTHVIRIMLWHPHLHQGPCVLQLTLMDNQMDHTF